MAPAIRPPLLSITIPCYHNLDQARRCVASILAQTWTDFDLTLADDGDGDDYREYVASLGDPRVRYQRNPIRLGAMRNMFQAIGAGAGKYTLAFHEDDLLGRHFLSAAVGVLESHPSCGFVAAELREFITDPSPEQLAGRTSDPGYNLFESPADFVRGILSGLEPMFGSVVYRRAALDGVVAAHDEYGTLVDRPFLMGIMQRWSAAVLREPLAWYRHHGDNARHTGMSTEHILHLFTLYRTTLPTPLNPRDRALFFTYSGYWLFMLYRLTAPAQRSTLRRFVVQAWRRDLYNPRWSRGYGRKRLLALMLTGQ